MTHLEQRSVSLENMFFFCSVKQVSNFQGHCTVSIHNLTGTSTGNRGQCYQELLLLLQWLLSLPPFTIKTSSRKMGQHHIWSTFPSIIPVRGCGLYQELYGHIESICFSDTQYILIFFSVTYNMVLCLFFRTCLIKCEAFLHICYGFSSRFKGWISWILWLLDKWLKQKCLGAFWENGYMNSLWQFRIPLALQKLLSSQLSVRLTINKLLCRIRDILTLLHWQDWLNAS